MLSFSRSLLSNTMKRKTRTKTKSKAKTKLKANDSVSGKQKIVAKNHQLEDNEEEEEEGFNLKSSAPSNSHGVQPLGNLYFNPGSVNSRNTGLGNLKILSDELVLEILGLLEGTQLGVLATVSKSFYVFTSHEPLWRNLVLDKLEGGFLYNGSWKFTYVSTFHPSFNVSRNASLPGLRVRDFYSDYLFQSWLCANLEMKPEWLESDNIIRKRGISLEDFVMNFEEPNKPVLLEGCMDNWDALKKWDRDYLVNLCGDVRFSVGPVKLMLEEYFRYSDQVKEERPLYLFDPKFAEKVPTLGSEYEVPVYFSEDLFSVLGNERPDYRWIIIGPAGSGSSFHIDPNSTSAWNAVIRGSKKWVLFPPDVVPPGVHPSADGAEVACPVSIIEWFMNFYSSTKNWKKKPIECICKAGEVIFVPNGWWHLVINLEESVAITQNYVSRRNLLNVLDFLKKPNASELVSGTRDRKNLYEKFKNAIKASFPGTIDELTLKAEEKARQKKLSFWDTVTDSKVGVMSMDTKNVASTEMVEIELEPSQDDVVYPACLFIVLSTSLGYMWVLVRVLISQTPGKEIITPSFIAVAIVIIMITAPIILSSIYICCFFVYCVVVLLMPRLPKKIKVVFDMNHIVVSASASRCSLFLAAIFLWLLEKFVKFVLVDKCETMPIPEVLSLIPYAMGFTFFLSVAAFSMGIRRQLIIIIKRHMVAFRPANSSL